MNLGTSTSSLRVSLASLIHWLANGQADKMNATCGLKSNGSLARLQADGSWVKTYQDCYQARLDGSLEAFSLTWTRWGIVLGGRYMALQRSEHLIEENVSSLWPTYLASEATHGGPNQRDSSGRPTLTALALWRTPQAHDAKSSKIQRGYTTDLNHQVQVLWPTPIAGNASQGRNSHDSAGKYHLTGAVHQEWPTPTAQDAKNVTCPPSQRERDTLPGARVRQGQQTQGHLNPEWVECLMGFPIGWTDLSGQQDLDNSNTIGNPHEPQQTDKRTV